MIELTRNQIAELRGCTASTVSRAHLEKTLSGGYDILNTEVWDYITAPTVERGIENHKRLVRATSEEIEATDLEELYLKEQIEYKKKQSRKLDLQHEIEKQNLVASELIGIWIGHFASGILNNFLTIGNKIARGDTKLKDRIDNMITKAIKKTLSSAEKELKKESEQIIKFMGGEG